MLPKWPSTIFEWKIDNNVNDDLATMYIPDQANEIVVKALTAGPLTLRCAYYNTLLKCGGTAVFQIISKESPVIQGPTSICVFNTASFTTSSQVFYNWTLRNSSGVNVDTSFNSTHFYANFSIAGTYTLSAEYPGLCAPADLIFNVNQVQSAPALSGISNTTIRTCPNVPYNFTISDTNPDGQYKWSVSNGGTFVGNDVGNTVAIKFGTAASHTITIVNESLTTPVCTSAPISFTLYTQQINAQITDNQPQITCGNTPFNYSANQLNSNILYTEGETYKWSISPSNLGSVTNGQDTNSISVLWNNVFTTTTATLTLEIKKCNITKIVTKTVTVIPVAQIAIAAPSSVCSDNPITFTLSATNNVPYPNSATVNWTFSDGTTATAIGNSITKIFTNNSLANISIIATASITDPNGCLGRTNLAANTISVLPSAAAAGITGSAYYCNTPINALLSATTTPAGGTIQWFKSGSNTVLGTGTTLLVTNAPNFGFGFYYFVATNSNGCIATSNQIQIFNNCPVIIGPSGCTLVPLPIVTNTSALSCIAPTTATNCNCGQINLIGDATNSLSQSWMIYGPNNFYHSNFLGNSIGTAAAPLLPGDYFITKAGVYNCSSGTISVPSMKKVTVPFYANFAYSISCSTNNNAYNINLNDTSPYFNPVTARTFSYFKGTSINGPWTLVSTTQNTTFTNQAPGIYFFKLIITGTLDGIPQTPCEKIIQFVINPFPVQSILVSNAPVDCHDTAVKFEVNQGNPQTESYFWTFDNGAANTLALPARVFDNSGTQTVSVLITNQYGCTKTLTTTFIVPPRCFGGDITPLAPVSCFGGKNIRLEYKPRNGECTGTYEWLRDGIMLASTTTSFFDISDAGTYRVRLRSANNCTYTSLSTAIPTFLVPPGLSLKAPIQACQYELINLEAFTTATNIKWFFNGVYQDTFLNVKKVASDFVVGVNTIVVIATNSFGCATTITKTILINPQPPKPIINIIGGSCTPFYITLEASGTPPFTWSNGMTGAIITVPEGGVYKVTSNAGNCSNSEIINVPKNPDNYLWTFPYGCYDSCNKNEMSVVGPLIPFSSWRWNSSNNGASIDGYGVMTPLLLNQSGVYSMWIKNTFCDKTSKELSFSNQQCNKCGIEYTVTNIESNNQGFCESSLTLELFNQTTSAITLSFSSLSSQIFTNPMTWTINPGLNTINLNLNPINGFLGGSIKLIGNGTRFDGTKCQDGIEIEVSYCNGPIASPRFNAETTKSEFSISPNPTTNLVAIGFENTTATTTIEIYDLLGKKIASKQCNGNKGIWNFDTTAMAQGLYIVVFKNDNEILLQQKLVKN